MNGPGGITTPIRERLGTYPKTTEEPDNHLHGIVMISRPSSPEGEASIQDNEHLRSPVQQRWTESLDSMPRRGV